MSLPELIVLLVSYAIIFGIFATWIYYDLLLHDPSFTHARSGTEAGALRTEYGGLCAQARGQNTEIAAQNKKKSALLRDLGYAAERAVPNDPIDTQIQPPQELPAETLPTLYEVWTGAAASSNTSTDERTLTVKGLPANPFSLVLLPLEKNMLPEGLRTLEVSPNRIIEPRMTVHAALTFRNPGGAAANGFRVRFGLPVELEYIPGTAQIEGVALEDRDDQTPFVQQSGADIGDIPAGGERRLSLAYRVADVIEDGSQVSIQAAIASLKVPIIGTNIVRLTVRSSPVLQTGLTSLTLTAIREPLPSEELRVNARIHNAGQSTAHEVVALLPVPEHTTVVAQSTTVGGRLYMPQNQRQSFGSERRVVVAETLEPGETIDMGYRVRIDSPLEDATMIVAHGSVCSQEISQFSLPAASITIASAASFEGDATWVRLECAEDVKPGDIIRIVACAKNVGTAFAREFSLTLALPDGLSHIAGSLTIDGAPTIDHDTRTGVIQLADLAPGETVNVALSVTVRSPMADGHELHVPSTITWSKGQRAFERTITARSAARFPLTFNKLERESPSRVVPAGTLAYSLKLHNVGTDAATQVRLQFTADPGIEQIRLRERDNEIELLQEGAVQLGTIKPGASRAFHIDARVTGMIEDQTQLRLSAALLTAQTARIDLGTAVHVVDSVPAFSPATSRITVDSDEPLQRGGLVHARLAVKNEGTNRGRAVRVTMLLPDELKLEPAKGAAGTDGAVEFGDIPAGETREAEVGLRLVGSIAGDLLHIGARLSAANLMPVSLHPIDLETHAEPSFEGTTLSTLPVGSVDAGGEVIYTLAMRNRGNGTARRLVAHLATLTDAVYAHASTTVNGIALQDHAGTSLLFSPEGLVLADVAAGVEAVVRWRAIVNTPLPPSTAIEAVALVQWDGARELFVSAQPLHVQSASAMPVSEPSLPFSILGAVAAPKALTTVPSAEPPKALARRAS
jgi:hypothetical protein